MELDGGLTKQDVRQALKKAQKGQQKMLRIDEGGAMTFAASEQFWSTTIYPNPGNVNPHDQVVHRNTWYYMLAPRQAWAPAGHPITHVSWDWDIYVDNDTDAQALFVDVCSWDQFVNNGAWACATLKSAGTLIPVGTNNGVYNRPNQYALQFEMDTTAFNSLHQADNGGYIFRVGHISDTDPVDTDLLRGVLFNYYQ